MTCLPLGGHLAVLSQVPEHDETLHPGLEVVPHLERDDAEAVDVNLVVVLGPSLADLGADVDGGAADAARLGARPRPLLAVPGGRPAARRRVAGLAAVDLGRGPPLAVLGEPKVPELDVALRVVEDIGRLEVTVDDALAVDVRQRREDLPQHLPSVDLLEPALLVDHFVQGPRAELHLDVEDLLHLDLASRVPSLRGGADVRRPLPRERRGRGPLRAEPRLGPAGLESLEHRRVGEPAAGGEGPAADHRRRGVARPGGA
mmetsp:Transcript_1854/g.4395  ORF Transcript_1854/g.4395 Transcript_1854/m.4395 type:complete len:259 (+) Transcript_1854:2040-2816(+)